MIRRSHLREKTYRAGTNCHKPFVTHFDPIHQLVIACGPGVFHKGQQVVTVPMRLRTAALGLKVGVENELAPGTEIATVIASLVNLHLGIFSIYFFPRHTVILQNGLNTPSGTMGILFTATLIFSRLKFVSFLKI